MPPAPLKPPIYENLSKLLKVILNVCNPPHDNPAIALFSRSVRTRYLLSILGIISVNSIEEKSAPNLILASLGSSPGLV